MVEHDEYAEFLQSQILDLQERLANHEHDKHCNRARLAKLRGVKFVDPNKEIPVTEGQGRKTYVI